MTVGLILAGTSFIAAAILQIEIDVSLIVITNLLKLLNVLALFSKVCIQTKITDCSEK